MDMYGYNNTQTINARIFSNLQEVTSHHSGDDCVVCSSE